MIKSQDFKNNVIGNKEIKINSQKEINFRKISDQQTFEEFNNNENLFNKFMTQYKNLIINNTNQNKIDY